MSDPSEAAQPGRKNGMVALIGSVAILSLVGVGGGWFLGKTLLPKVETAQAAAATEVAAGEAAAGEAGAEGGIPNANAGLTNLVALDPIITNLGYPADNWVRLELSLLFDGVVEAPLAQEVHQEILAYLRTVSLQQIQGPRGFQYLRDDVREIVDLRSKGRISKVLFRTFVIE